MIIELVSDKSAIPYHLLQLADPSRSRIDSYLEGGKCYTARVSSRVIGVIVLKEIDQDSVEIMNIAIEERCRGLGYGKQLIKYVQEESKQAGYKRIIIGTANSSLAQLGLYQREGFEIYEIRKNFFIDNYEEPIIENDIPCKHLIMLEKNLPSESAENDNDPISSSD